MHNKDIDILARTLYAEARGEYKTTGIAAFIAVANVVFNRLKFPHLFGKSVQEVCLKPYQFSCWLERDPNYLLLQKITQADPLFEICWQVAEEGIKQKYPDLTHQSDHYHHFTLSLPYWARNQTPKVILGKHLFYQLHPPLK